MTGNANYEDLQYEIFSNLLKCLKGIILFTINLTWIEPKPATFLYDVIYEPINCLYVVLGADHSDCAV
jgi:hypothetical protein